jgi:hypothetical protein
MSIPRPEMVASPVIGHLMRLGFARGMVADHVREMRRVVGIRDIPHLVFRVAGEDRVAVDDGRLVEVPAAELRADLPENLPRWIRAVWNRARRGRQFAGKGQRKECAQKRAPHSIQNQAEAIQGGIAGGEERSRKPYPPRNERHFCANTNSKISLLRVIC